MHTPCKKLYRGIGKNADGWVINMVCPGLTGAFSVQGHNPRVAWSFSIFDDKLYYPFMLAGQTFLLDSARSHSIVSTGSSVFLTISQTGLSQFAGPWAGSSRSLMGGRKWVSVKGQQRGPCSEGAALYLDCCVESMKLHLWWNCVGLNTHPHTSASKTAVIWIRSVDCVSLLLISWLWGCTTVLQNVTAGSTGWWCVCVILSL